MKFGWFLSFILLFNLLSYGFGENQYSILKKQKYQITEELTVPCNISMCTGPLSGIYCHGPILTNSWIFGLEKTCPGNKLRFPADEVIANFEKLLYPIKKEDFQHFCNENFEDKQYLETVDLKDWDENPKFIEEIKNEKHKKLSKEIHERWNRLARQFTSDVHAHPDLYPLLPVKNPFIVPGGRFDVYFYWDTYWIIKGLLVSNMFETVKGIIQNFADLIGTLGYVPNSGNIQLTRRSQPPLFSHMVWEYTKATGKYENEWLERMQLEMQFWEKNRTVNFEKHTMFVYNTSTNCPRPENFLVDYNLGINTQQKSNPSSVWKSISSACESGWDFSARWMSTPGEMSTLHTDKIIPVDLNVIMALNYHYISSYANHFQRYDQFAVNLEKFEKLRDSIETVLWDEKHGVWFDFDMLENAKNFNFYPSNVYPLMISDFVKYSEHVERYMKASGALNFKGGIPSGLPLNSTQQWDFPNVWAPNQHFVIQSFLNSNSSFLKQEAQKQAENFIDSVYNGLYENGGRGAIWEKYDARSTAGAPGAGGEYVVQEGFGWTNGAVLDLIWSFSFTSTSRVSNQKRLDHSLFDNVSLNKDQQSALVYTAAGFCGLVATIIVVKGVIWRKRQLREDAEAQVSLLGGEDENLED